MNQEGYTIHNQVKLVNGGREYFLLLQEMIRSSRDTIFLQYYIFSDDDTGKTIQQALVMAANRGVRVFLMVDGYASQHLSKEFVSHLRNAGVRFKWFEPLFRSSKFYLGRRLHYKTVVVDARYSLTGGVNISNRYNDLPHTPAWMDMALYCEGEAAAALQQVCMSLWRKESRGMTLPSNPPTTLAPGSAMTQQVRVRLNDWVKRKNQITRSYLYMLLYARKEILIMCSYFLPGRMFRREILNAVKRGVAIKVVLAGPSDVMVAKHAERYLYNWLLRNKISVYEYQKTVLHAKMAVADASFVTVGSYNINNISAYASLELNMDVKDPLLAAEAKQRIEQIIVQDCREVTRENFPVSRNIFRRWWEWLCYRFINTMLSLFTFYFKQEE